MAHPPVVPWRFRPINPLSPILAGERAADSALRAIVGGFADRRRAVPLAIRTTRSCFARVQPQAGWLQAAQNLPAG